MDALLLDMIAAGFALCGLTTALLIQCGNKRTAPKKKSIKASKGSVKSIKGKGRSKKSSRSKKSKRGSVSSKKSSRSSKCSKSESVGSSKAPKQKSARSKDSSKKSDLANDVKIQQAKTPQKSVERPNFNDPSLKSLQETQKTTKDTRTASNSRPLELQMEPKELRFSNHGGVSKIRLHNPTTVRQAIKVKCSDNTLYRVNPVYGFVEPGQKLDVMIIRQNGSSSKIDKLVFVTAEASGESNDFKKLFKSGTKGETSCLVLPLIA